MTLQVNEPEPSCPRCGWRIPEPFAGVMYWNAWDKGAMRREPDGTYTFMCPECGVPIIAGLVYKGQR